MATTPVCTSTVLGIFAHPDDESLACGGLIARMAALGARVVLVSLTRGEAGPPHPDVATDPNSLGARRAAEFRAAADTLGAAEAIVRDFADGMLPWVDAAVLEADIRSLIETVQPEVVVTFDADGLYWHPDHIAVHERTTAVVAALGTGGPALFYVSMPPGQMRAVTVRAGTGGPAVPGLHDCDAFGADAPVPTLVVDAGRCAPHKLAAIQCHVSQFTATAFAALSAADAPLIAIEHYRRAPVGATGPTAIDRLAAPPAA